MAASRREKNLVIIQLTGANDPLNTLVPYNNGLYYDFRPNVNQSAEELLPLNDELGLTPHAPAVKELWDRGKLALINGIGYANPNRSHFRSMDIWHTAEPTKIATEGWLGRAVRDMDPQSRKRVDRRQLRPWTSQVPGLQGRAGCICRQPGDLRAVPRGPGRPAEEVHY